MRALVQRATRGAVTVEGEVVGAIDAGLVVLVGVGDTDSEAEAEFLAGKVATLRIFSDADGKFNLSLLDTAGSALIISQFTLYADARKGRRPSFVHAAPPDRAEALVEHFAASLRQQGVPVEMGRFRSHMLVEIMNDGPVTLWLDTAELQRS